MKKLLSFVLALAFVLFIFAAPIVAHAQEAVDMGGADQAAGDIDPGKCGAAMNAEVPAAPDPIGESIIPSECSPWPYGPETTKFQPYKWDIKLGWTRAAGVFAGVNFQVKDIRLEFAGNIEGRPGGSAAVFYPLKVLNLQAMARYSGIFGEHATLFDLGHHYSAAVRVDKIQEWNLGVRGHLILPDRISRGQWGLYGEAGWRKGSISAKGKELEFNRSHKYINAGIVVEFGKQVPLTLAERTENLRRTENWRVWLESLKPKFVDAPCFHLPEGSKYRCDDWDVGTKFGAIRERQTRQFKLLKVALLVADAYATYEIGMKLYHGLTPEESEKKVPTGAKRLALGITIGLTAGASMPGVMMSRDINRDYFIGRSMKYVATQLAVTAVAYGMVGQKLQH